jgi:hypothetical protein
MAPGATASGAIARSSNYVIVELLLEKGKPAV